VGDTGDGMQFLTVEEAARRLGQSRLRVREAAARGLLRSRRDNEGRLRVDLPEARALARGGDLGADDVLSFLFDEVEDLEATLADRDATIARLTDLAGRQAEALDRADTALGAAEAREARLSGLLDRALGHLEAESDARDRLTDVTDAALARLEATGADLEASLAQTAKFEALLARAVALAERDSGAEGLKSTAERAMALLDDALGRAEAGEAAAARRDALLDRALATGERMQADLAEQAARIEKQGAALDTALAMSERAVALAARDNAPPRGFWARLFGRT
jgi:chromosome segregation ATPase